MAAQSIGRYRILRELGRGATATVYLARDPGSGRQVAVKVLAPAFTAAPDFAARFEQTLKALSALDHPYLLTPHDYGHDEEQYFIVMRYLPGGTLADRMDGRPMLLAEVVPLLQRLAEALDAAHTAHLLHGDLHPADVLFDLHERAVLADLGLAQLLDPVAGPSPTGTAAYMSPEQIAGQPIDGRADVYALGILLFEMLTGRQPYSGATPQALLQQHLEQPVPQLSAAALSHLVLPLEFNLVIARALAKNRDYRYPTAGVLAEAVRTTFLMAGMDASAEAPAAELPPVMPLSSTVPAVPPAAPTPPAVPVPPPPNVSSAADETLVAPVSTPPAEPPPPVPPAPAATEPAAPPPPPPLAAKPAPEPAFAMPIPAELVREPAPVSLRRGPSPVSLLLILIGIILVGGFLLLARSPNLRGLLIAPTATPTASATVTITASATETASATVSATATRTVSPTPSLTTTPTLTPSLTATATDTLVPSETATPTRTPTRRPTLAPFTPTLAPSVTAAPPVTPASGATSSHLGPPPSATP